MGISISKYSDDSIFPPQRFPLAKVFGGRGKCSNGTFFGYSSLRNVTNCTEAVLVSDYSCPWVQEKPMLLS
jgi:hypothetical protein